MFYSYYFVYHIYYYEGLQTFQAVLDGFSVKIYEKGEACLEYYLLHSTFKEISYQTVYIQFIFAVYSKVYLALML